MYFFYVTHSLNTEYVSSQCQTELFLKHNNILIEYLIIDYVFDSIIKIIC